MYISKKESQFSITEGNLWQSSECV